MAPVSWATQGLLLQKAVCLKNIMQYILSTISNPAFPGEWVIKDL